MLLTGIESKAYVIGLISITVCFLSLCTGNFFFPEDLSAGQTPRKLLISQPISSGKTPLSCVKIHASARVLETLSLGFLFIWFEALPTKSLFKCKYIT